MTEHAQGLLRKQEHLAPLPIPTGQPASDLMNIIWRKNQVFLDIGSFSMGAGWLTLHMGTFLFVAVAIWAALGGDIVASLVVLGVMGGLMGTLWYLFIKQYRKPLIPPIRFNRQRREVCITEPDGSYWFVPWERVHAIAPSALSLNTGGASKHGSLLLWFPLKGEEHEDYAPDKQGWVLMVNTGGGISSMAQWECIRSFMEVGPEAIPEPLENICGLSLKQIFWREFDKSCQERGLFLTVVWEIGIMFPIFNPMGAHWITRKKLAHIPELTAPEVIEWSKPLPREQWAKRSPELEQAIAEREAALATA
ncbi:MAG: hypothetical protein FHK79_05270 [Pseudomonas sp.]|uniref:hypothetical protein n=2 Tax=Bacteria TaxID=2 RepID=UPI000CE3F217|nr:MULTISPECIES: hypothetical protein [Stutzerimonas stutzeri subgroup]TVT71525.1 MAG: hypothetical protein FHK79_05270 [Pseudomonas sp.]UEG61406.1 hypothetical protein LLJ08_20140 [Stutzerimonas chloritidismutans]